jgi:succinate dehydrogenase/fumarate reductase flavoprotein subunit
MLEADLLVIGGGMAGMSCAAYAAAHDLQVIVVEKGSDVGGSALLSGGGYWTATSVEDLSRVNPTGDRALVRTLVDGYETGMDWIESLGVQVGPRRDVKGVHGFGSVAHSIDIYSYIQRCKAVVGQAGGYIALSAGTEALLTAGARVVGARVRDRDGLTEVHAPVTVLATGGFQGDAGLRRELIGGHAAGLLVRSNPLSSGAGLRLARSVGAALSGPTANFYGHLIPTPRNKPFEPADFLRLAQFYSPRTILLAKDGRRFVDESKAYYRNASAVAALPGQRAILVADHRVREEILTFAAGEQFDRPSEAKTVGAHVAEADTLTDLESQVAGWGYRNLTSAVEGYNRTTAVDPDHLDPPRALHRLPIDRAPWFAIEVEPAITFTFRGIRIDEDAHVLDDAGVPIEGLLAAGADAGGLYVEAYGGGLSMSLVFGLRAARTALEARVSG